MHRCEGPHRLPDRSALPSGWVANARHGGCGWRPTGIPGPGARSRPGDRTTVERVLYTHGGLREHLGRVSGTSRPSRPRSPSIVGMAALERRGRDRAT